MTVTSTSSTGEGLELELTLVDKGGAVHYDVEAVCFCSFATPASAALHHSNAASARL